MLDVDEGKEKVQRRHQRRFTGRYKAQTVKPLLSGRKTAGQVARDLDLTETSVRHLVKQATVASLTFVVVWSPHGAQSSHARAWR